MRNSNAALSFITHENRPHFAILVKVRSGVSSQTQEVLHLPGVFLNCFLKETSQDDRRKKELDNAKASTLNIEAQVLPNRRTTSKWPNGG